MRVKSLSRDKYEVVAVIDGDDCPAEDFIINGEAETEASRSGLADIIEKVASNGLENVPAKWWHEASKQKKIYEFRKGPLRLFFFKGQGAQIAVCTGGIRKTTPKADKQKVAQANEWRKEYFAAVEANTLVVEVDQNEDQ